MISAKKQSEGRYQTTLEVDFITLTEDDIYTFDRTGQNLFIVRGSAWITYEEVDVVLAEGQHVNLGSGSGKVTISSLDRDDVVFGIRFAA